ncbi:hypothetical protein SpCBS45565_g05424 [Spizellomyces sp. 'palustris']|nr:hypothetical protein SpCBS45565_g05424 [Spizellomyces sp. 'palustris']
MLPTPSANWNRGSALTPPPPPPTLTSASTATAATVSTPSAEFANFETLVGSVGSGSAASSSSSAAPPIRRPSVQYALAAQQVITTVVTTTTTRTTDYPPLYIPPPPVPHPLDPEVYPLSKTPTPPALKKFCFDLNGIPTSFREVEVVDNNLNHNQVTSTSVQSYPIQGAASPTLDLENLFADPVIPIPKGNRKRPVSPENYAAMTATELEESNVSPSLVSPAEGRSRAPKRRGPLGAPHAHSIRHDDHRITPVGKPMLAGTPIPIPLTPFPEANPVDIPGAAQSTDTDVSESVTPNLPSPTMSPTTKSAFPNPDMEAQHPVISSILGSLPTMNGAAPSTSFTFTEQSQIPAEFADLPSLGDIPYILSTFDNLPTALKSYLLLQLLRRCPFPTLQFVSSLILPSLKRDFVGLLPVELSYQVLQYLDLRSLGRCAAVSKAWKRVVDGDGAEVAVWKKRLLSEGWYDEDEIELEITFDNPSIRTNPPPGLRSADPMEDSDDEYTLGRSSRAGQNRVASAADWPENWKSEVSSPSHARKVIEFSSENGQLPAQLYKNLYRRHHLIRQNWFHGRYKHISFPGHAFNVVTCLQFDARKIVSGSDDQTIHIYDTGTGELRKRLEGHEGGVWALQYWNDVLVSGSTDRTVRVWDMDTGRCTHLFEGHTSTVRCLIIIIPWRNPETGRLEPEVPLVVTGSRDATLRVWRLPHPKRDEPYLPTTTGGSSPTPGEANQNPFFRHVLSGHNNSVRAIAGFGNVLVSGSYDCTVRIWNLTTGNCDHVCRGHREKVYSVGYSHELQRAVSGSMDATVRVWCTKTGQAMFNLEGHTSLVGLLELSPQYLVSAAADATLRIWSPTTGQCLANLTGHSAAITCFHHDPKLNRIVSGSDGGVKVWELSSTGYGSGQPPPGAPFAPSLAFTQGPNGPQPVHGRFIRDLVGNVQGVWRVRMDEQRLVCAVQREGGRTWFEVLDFTDGLDCGTKVEGPGDRFAPADASEEDEEDDEDYGENGPDDGEGEEGDESDDGDGEEVDEEEGGEQVEQQPIMDSNHPVPTESVTLDSPVDTQMEQPAEST